MNFPPKLCIFTANEIYGYIMFVFVSVGDDGIGLSKIDPLFIKSLQVSRGEESPVNINCRVANAVAVGANTLKFIKMK